jgi:hypothetical protein
MRAIICVMALLGAASPAFAQEPQPPATLVEEVGALPIDQLLSAAHARALNSAALADGKLDAAEKAFLEKIAVGQPFAVNASGSQRQLKPKPEAQHVAALLARPADLGPMWSDPAKIGDLVEIARWAPVSRDRVARFAGGQLLASFNQSSIDNGYAPFKTLLEQKWSAMKALPDVAAREAGRSVLYDAAVLVRQQSVSTGAPLPDHTFAWLGTDETKASIR